MSSFGQFLAVAGFTVQANLAAEVAPVGGGHHAANLGDDLGQRVCRGVDRLLDLIKCPQIVAGNFLRQIALRQRLGHANGVLECGVNSVGQLVEQLGQLLAVAGLAVQRHFGGKVTFVGRSDNRTNLVHDFWPGCPA